MTTRIKLRRDTAINWTTTNPILAAGEPGLESDTGKIKYGDGVSRWNALEHTGGDALSDVGSITIQTGDSDRWFVRLRREDESTYMDGSGLTAQSTCYDSEGNVIALIGVNLDDDGAAIFKFDSAGELIWKKSLGEIDDSRRVTSNIIVDSDDNIIFALREYSNSETPVIVKMNGATGSIIFSNTLDFGWSADVTAIAIDSDSNIIIGGDFFYNIDDYDPAFVAKLNPTATSVTWQKSLENSVLENSYITGLEVDFNDDIVVVGMVPVTFTIDGSPETRDQIFVAKFSSTGTEDWQKTVALNANEEGRAFGLSLDSIGNIYVTGNCWVDNPDGNDTPYEGLKSNAVVIFKMSTLGALAWDRRVGPGPCDWVGVSTAVGDDGDLYLYASTYQYKPSGNVSDNNGYWNATIALARYNKSNGELIWQRYFDNPLAQEVPTSYLGTSSLDMLDVSGDKIIIGGSVRFGLSDGDLSGQSEDSKYFNQAFLAQFDTDGTKFSVEGWTLTPSYIPGKLTNTLVATTGTVTVDTNVNISPTTATTISVVNAGISVRRAASKVNTWTFGKDGTLTIPEDSNIKLQQRQLGFVSMYGEWNQSNDDIWYESVCHDTDGFAYVLGSDNWGNGYAHIHKFTPEGELVWKRQLRSGDGADFDVTAVDNTYTGAIVDSGGDGYKVGDKIVLSGNDLGGSNSNSLTLEVTGISNSLNSVGGVQTVSVVAGVAAGSGTYYGVSDYNDNAECDIKTMSYNPATGNVVIVVSMPTFNGDTLDSEWTETVVVTIDSGSGAVVSTTTLSDEGDIYPNDISISSSGKIAVVGEKYNEYAEYGTITVLPGSSTDKLWVAKADIDAEHYPGEPNGNSISDWWITGGNITDQAQVQNVNEYINTTGTISRPGSGLVVDVVASGGVYTLITTVNSGTNYLTGQRFLITGDLLGGTTPANDLTFTADADSGNGGVIVSTGNYQGASVADNTYPTLTPSKVNGTGGAFTLYFSAVTGAYNYGNVYSSGQDYVAGDVVTILGTRFAGGTTPVNDITVTINSVSSGAIDNNFSVSGAHTSTHLLIQTNASVDFNNTGTTFSIKQNLGGEAFIWTPDFSSAIGGNNTDWFSGVTWNSTGTHLYAVGSGRYETDYDQALVVKYSSTGTLLASKYLNGNNGDNGAERGAVALMANDCIVTVYDLYNDIRNDSDEVFVTKLDRDLDVVWQLWLGIDGGEGSNSPYSPISVAVDPATDEILIAFTSGDSTEIINDDCIYIVKLDSDGEVLWKRIFGIHESDSGMNRDGSGNKALSIHGDKFTIAGWTDGPSDENDNAVIATLPLDGTGVGLHGIWTYKELDDTRIKVQRVTNPEAATFTATVHTGNITDTDNVKYYYTSYPDSEEFTIYPTVIRSEEGGAIEFADGSKQTFSTAIIPQVRISENRYTLRPEDSGRHILVDDSQDYSIIIPNYRSVYLPIGYTFTIINTTNSDIFVRNEEVNSGERGEMWFSGGDAKTPVVGISDNGSGQMVTLVKIKEGTESDDGDDHGDIWMIAGADIYDDY
jgi:hypothetical protein